MALLRSGQLRGLRLGGRGMWRISEDDLQAYLDAAYQETAERIAAGDLGEGQIGSGIEPSYEAFGWKRASLNRS